MKSLSRIWQIRETPTGLQFGTTSGLLSSDAGLPACLGNNLPHSTAIARGTEYRQVIRTVKVLDLWQGIDQLGAL